MRLLRPPVRTPRAAGLSAAGLTAAGLLLAPAAQAQADHAGHGAASASGAPAAVQVFAADGFRVDAAAPPPGSGVARAGAHLPGGTYVHIVYGRPYVRGRLVYGGLVAWDAPWVTGAHYATELTATAPVSVGGRTLAAGTYSLVTVPRRNGPWRVAINRGVGGHLTDTYDPALDVLSLDIRPDTLAARAEALTFRFEPGGGSSGAVLSFAWDRLGFRLPIAPAAAPERR